MSTVCLNHSDDNDLSPKAMAYKALAAGIADRKRRQMTSEEDRTISGKRVHIDANVQVPNEKLENNTEVVVDTKDLLGNDLDPEKQLESIWNKVALAPFLGAIPQDDDDDLVHKSKNDHILGNVHEATEATSKLAQMRLEYFFREGLEAFHRCDSLSRELHQAKELCDARGKEVIRLQNSESESKHLVSVCIYLLSFFYLPLIVLHERLNTSFRFINYLKEPSQGR
jgi:hypothetical protein